MKANIFRTTRSPFPLALAALLSFQLAGCTLPDEAAPASPALVVEPEPECFTIPRYAPGGFGWEVRLDPEVLQLTNPAYNPRNGDEITYRRLDTLGSPIASGFYRANLKTGQQLLLPPPAALASTYLMPLSSTGWLVFPAAGGNIWKMKSNGDSLTALTSYTSGFCASPAWSADGQRVAFIRNNGTAPGSGIGVVSARTGQLLTFVPDAQTRAYSTTSLAWSPNGSQVAFSGGPNARPDQPSICLLDVATSTVTAVDTVTLGTSAGSMTWLPNGRELLWTDGSVWITDVLTRRHRLIRAACASGSRSIGTVALAPNGREIMVGLIDWRVEGSTKYYRYSLETMDLVTGLRTGTVKF